MFKNYIHFPIPEQPNAFKIILVFLRVSSLNAFKMLIYANDRIMSPKHCVFPHTEKADISSIGRIKLGPCG